MGTPRHRVVIVGGGIAGLEALLAVRAIAGDRVELTLVSAEEDFVYRPMAVAAPFALGQARHTPLADVAKATGATLRLARLETVDAQAKGIHTSDGPVEYDELLLAVGAQAEPAYARATTWDDRSDAETLGGLLRDLEGGYTTSLAVVIPPGPGWPLPAYELALLIRRQAQGMGLDPSITLVTPEDAPLATFGPHAVEAITEELEAAGIALETGTEAELVPGHATTVRLHPSTRSIDVGRVLALPRLHGRLIAGIPADEDGFVEVDEHCRVQGVPGVWAAGDGIASEVKFGGLATQQADAAAEDIAHVAGVADEPRPYRPVLRGRLLTGATNRWMRSSADGDGGESATHALWWPPGKVAGRYLAPWLATRDDEAVIGRIPESDGLAVHLDLHQGLVRSV
jgi:sulfide:quinone oxidoreductase